MAQTTTGLKALLNAPNLYRAQQFVWGAPKMHAITRDYLALAVGDSLLDIGCGPADIVAALPTLDYVGVDLSESYIEVARSRFAGRGTFHVGNVYKLPSLIEQQFDAVLAQSLLHHLDDDEALALFRFAEQKLVPGGRLVTADPCYHPGQGRFERFLVDSDRGRNVRTPETYRALAATAFTNIRCELRSDGARFPYSYCYMIAER